MGDKFVDMALDHDFVGLGKVSLAMAGVKVASGLIVAAAGLAIKALDSAMPADKSAELKAKKILDRMRAAKVE